MKNIHDNASYSVEYSRVFSGLKFFKGASGQYESVVPLVNEDVVLMNTMMIVMGRVSDGDVSFDDGWRIYKALFGNGKDVIMGFVGSMANFQVPSDDEGGFVVSRKSVFFEDYSKWMSVNKSDVFKKFSSEIASESDKVLIGIRKILASW
ncbi:MAG: hypothetical protein Q7R22_014720 [Verrucomicrobiota bacterium JB025]|nr:hypothetical protein [Verrucomicrobiota bacterium JB025]